MKKTYWFLITTAALTVLIVSIFTFRKSISQIFKNSIHLAESRNTPAGKGKEPDHYRIVLVEMFSYADSVGLYGGDYHKSFLKTYDSLLAEQNNVKNEQVFTDSALAFLFQAAYGKDIDLSYSGIKQTIDSAKIINAWKHFIVQGSWQKTLDSLEPKRQQYILLKNAFERISAFAREFPEIDSVDTSNIVAIKATSILKLKAYGLLHQADSRDSIRDDTFNFAILGFQKMIGIDTSGKLDDLTIEKLEYPLSKRLAEIKRSLNFWRWTERLAEHEFVFVNVAATHLSVIGDSSTNISMRVILGQSTKQTPLFTAYITKVTTYPHWVVPLSIETKEMLPRIKNDINYLKKNNLEVIDSKGNILNPAQINWDKYSKNRFPFIIRQATGCDDALGIIKFDLSIPFDIYFHDTNERDLFKRNQRFLSHGCVRVEKPLELAKYLLKDRFDSADVKYLDQCMKGQKPQDIVVKKKVPAIVYYLTADFNEIGSLQFYPDVYGLEK